MIIVTCLYVNVNNQDVIILKKGICSFGFPSEMSLKEIFAEAKKYGFDGVELCMALNGELTPDTPDEKLEQIKADAANAGIELYSVTTSVYWSASLTSDSLEERDTAKSYAINQLRIAKKLGCDTVLVVPGHTGVGFAPGLGVVEYDVAYDRALDAIKELAHYAEDAGVVIGIENVWNKFLLSPLEMKSFIDEVGSEYVGAYFDVGNVLINSYPEHWIKILGGRIAKVHFKDFDMATNHFCYLLEGDVNYPAVINAFRNIGYDGWVTAEYAAKNDNPAMLRHTSYAMDRIINF